METKRLGNTGIEISRIGFGAWAAGGGGYQFGWGSQDDRGSVAAIERALDGGVNWIDTAPVYGLGRSEEVVGRALREIGPARSPYVFTKCGLVWDQETRAISHSLEPASLRREVEASLRRLGVDAIDLYQVHWPGPWGQPPANIEDAWRTLTDLQREGKLRHLGVSNFGVEEMERIRSIAPIGSLQPPYSLLRRKIEEDILPYCLSHDIGVIVYSPMQAGLLTGKMTRERIASLPEDDWRGQNPYFVEPRLTPGLQFVEVLRGVTSRLGRTPGELAVAWALRHPAVTGAIVGFRRPQQVTEILGAAALDLTDDVAAEIESALPG